MFCKVLGILSETSWQWHPVTFHPHEFVRPRNLSHIRSSSLSTLLWLCNRLFSSSAAGEDHFHLNLQRLSIENNHPKPLGPCVTARDNNWAFVSPTHFCTVIRLASLREGEWFSALIGLGKSQPGLLQPWLAVHTFIYFFYRLSLLSSHCVSVSANTLCCAPFLSAQSELVRIRVLHYSIYTQFSAVCTSLKYCCKLQFYSAKFWHISWVTITPFPHINPNLCLKIHNKYSLFITA